MILFCQRYVNSQQITDPVGKYLQMCTDQHFESGTEYCAGLRMHTAKKHLLFWQEVVQDQVKSSPNFLELCHEIVSLPKCANFWCSLTSLILYIGRCIPSWLSTSCSNCQEEIWTCIPREGVALQHTAHHKNTKCLLPTLNYVGAQANAVKIRAMIIPTIAQIFYRTTLNPYSFTHNWDKLQSFDISILEV